MAESNNHSSQRRSNAGRSSGRGYSGNRNSKGYSSRNGGKGYKSRRFNSQGGSRYNGNRHASGDGDTERRYNNGGNNNHRDGQQSRRNFHHGNGQGNRSGYRRNADHRDDNRRDGNPRYHNTDRNNKRPQNGERHEFTSEQKREYRENKRREYLSKPRRNSDGTMSFPSQNPYTDRRPGEPKMPKGMEWSMLSKDERERLRGLSKEHAENIGLHTLAAFALEESDPDAALEHAKWVAHQASRIDFARETLAFIAYRQGDYKLAMREFRTAYRMNGFADYLPFIADCERGIGNPKKAIEVALSDDATMLRGEAKAEMFLVYAGALGDLEHWDKAVEIVHTLGRSKGLSGAYRMRAVQAEQFFLEQAGRTDEAMALDDLLDRLEMQYADVDEDETADDVVIDYDLHHMSDDLMEELGISEEDAQFAPSESEPDVHDDASTEADSSSSDESDRDRNNGETDSTTSDSATETGDSEQDPANLDDELTIEDEYRQILAEAGVDSDDDSQSEDVNTVDNSESDAADDTQSTEQ